MNPAPKALHRSVSTGRAAFRGSLLRPGLHRWLASVVTALLGLGLLTGVASGAQAAPTSAADSIALLMKWFDQDTGRIGDDWWTSGVSLSTVMTYQQATGDTQYEYAISEAFAKNHTFTNAYIDDTGWWALVWLQAYDITGNQEYLDMARTTTDYMHDYWDDKCGGGVYWSVDKDYKAAISNSLFLAATAGLHNRLPGDTKYLGWANEEWKWLTGAGKLIDQNNQVRDGVTIKDCKLNNVTLTYNQGVALQGLMELSTATGDSALLSKARTIATATLKYKTRNGVLNEGCEPGCGGDFEAFKGIFVRYLGLLAARLKTSEYDGFFFSNAASIVTNDTNESGEHGNSWTGPFTGVTASTQASASAALVAALPRTTFPGSVTSGLPGKCLDVYGGSSAPGTRVQLWTCNGTGGQVFSQHPDGTLRVLGQCVDATGAGTANFTKTIIWPCHGYANQVWERYDGGYRNPVSGRCLDVPGAGLEDGLQLQLFDCNGTAAQKWSAPNP